MADPLTQAAESLAPAPAGPTNYFDPEPGRNVISRYGNAAALGRDIEGALRLDAMARQSRLGAMREQEYVDEAPLRERQREVGMLDLDRQEQDLLDQRDARMMEGEFLNTLWSSIDRESPDYQQQFERAAASIPENLRNAPGVEQWFDYHEGNVRDLQMRQRAEQQDALIQGRADDRAIFSAVRAAGGEINPERLAELRQQYPDREDYIAAAIAEGSGKKRSTDIEDFRTKTNIRQEAAKERMQMYIDRKNMESAKRDAYDRAMNHLVDKTAFPSEVEKLKQQYLADNPGTKPETVMTLLESKMPDALAEAEAREKNRDDLFTEQARDMSEEEFVNKEGEMPEVNKAKRRAFWRVANDMAIAAPSAADQAVDAPRVDMPGFEADERPPQTLDRATALQFLQEAGGDKAKARQLAKEAGYDF